MDPAAPGRSTHPLRRPPFRPTRTTSPAAGAANSSFETAGEIEFGERRCASSLALRLLPHRSPHPKRSIPRRSEKRCDGDIEGARQPHEAVDGEVLPPMLKAGEITGVDPEAFRELLLRPPSASPQFGDAPADGADDGDGILGLHGRKNVPNAQL